TGATPSTSAAPCAAPCAPSCCGRSAGPRPRQRTPRARGSTCPRRSPRPDVPTPKGPRTRTASPTSLAWPWTTTSATDPRCRWSWRLPKGRVQTPVSVPSGLSAASSPVPRPWRMRTTMTSSTNILAPAMSGPVSRVRLALWRLLRQHGYAF
ncbi:unnamed protein product, partial [Prorocentrum cordatum]